MTQLDPAIANLTTPAVLAFLVGIFAATIRSDLHVPRDIVSGLSMYLLISIGLKGGAGLADSPLGEVWLPIIATVAVGVITPVGGYVLLRRRFDRTDAAAIAAHYGSTSVVTFAAALMFLDAAGISYEPFVPVLVAVLEVPAIVVALGIASWTAGNGSRGEALREALAGRTVLLLVGGLFVGVVSGPDGLEMVAPFFVAPFHGILVFFLLEMGMVAGKRLADLRQAGVFLAVFAVTAPLVQGALGVAAGRAAGLSVGGATVLGVLAGSASYIAAPAAVSIALPKANPSYYLTASLGVTFPFNLTVGIPAYHWMARALYGIG